ncbi:unnamed protein product [Gongylonema pulchrum]|uniref:Uncharacterized protein n=1 Tax=Gongylonema pulchrum TaxID=637853 RepID=A0A183D5I9_9BILA|nr:unnamed protein product [Gongylonema pulchrum]
MHLIPNSFFLLAYRDFFQKFKTIFLIFWILKAQEDAHLYKKYTIGVFDRSQIIKQYNDHSTDVSPNMPHNGCAGFESSFFIHLRRHWDLNPKPLEFVNWFLQDWRRAADKVKAIVETRVQNYQNSWNSYFRALVPPETGIFKRPTNESYKLVRANPGTMRRTHKGMSLYPRRKKRQFDEIDRISELRRMRLRNRFSELERDTLILIRAVSFFLNPMYRFWLEPAVLRDVMHEHVQVFPFFLLDYFVI